MRIQYTERDKHFEAEFGIDVTVVAAQLAEQIRERGA